MVNKRHEQKQEEQITVRFDAHLYNQDSDDGTLLKRADKHPNFSNTISRQKNGEKDLN